MFHFKRITMFNRILIIVSLHVSSILINQDEKSVPEAELFFLYFIFKVLQVMCHLVEIYFHSRTVNHRNRYHLNLSVLRV